MSPPCIAPAPPAGEFQGPLLPVTGVVPEALEAVVASFSAPGGTCVALTPASVADIYDAAAKLEVSAAQIAFYAYVL